MIDIYSALDFSKVEKGWQPAKHSVKERKPTELSIGDWSLKCREWFPNLRFNELTKFCESNGRKLKPSSVEQLYICLGEMGWRIDKAKAQDVFEKVAQPKASTNKGIFGESCSCPCIGSRKRNSNWLDAIFIKAPTKRTGST